MTSEAQSPLSELGEQVCSLARRSRLQSTRRLVGSREQLTLVKRLDGEGQCPARKSIL